MNSAVSTGGSRRSTRMNVVRILNKNTLLVRTTRLPIIFTQYFNRKQFYFRWRQGIQDVRRAQPDPGSGLQGQVQGHQNRDLCASDHLQPEDQRQGFFRGE